MQITINRGSLSLRVGCSPTLQQHVLTVDPADSEMLNLHYDDDLQGNKYGMICIRRDRRFWGEKKVGEEDRNSSMKTRTRGAKILRPRLPMLGSPYKEVTSEEESPVIQ
jgi:hypothetical protein